MNFHNTLIVVKKADLEKLQLILELYVPDIKLNPFKKYKLFNKDLNIIYISNRLIWTYSEYSLKEFETYKTKHSYSEVSVDYILNNL